MLKEKQSLEISNDYVKERIQEKLDIYNSLDSSLYTLYKKYEEIQRIKNKYTSRELERVKNKIWVAKDVNDYKNIKPKLLIVKGSSLSNASSSHFSA